MIFSISAQALVYVGAQNYLVIKFVLMFEAY